MNPIVYVAYNQNAYGDFYLFKAHALARSFIEDAELGDWGIIPLEVFSE